MADDDVDLKNDDPPETKKSAGSGLMRGLGSVGLLVLLALLGVLAWRYWPGLPDWSGDDKVADGPKKDKDDDKVAEPERPRGPMGITCDTSLPGVRWSLEDRGDRNGKSLTVDHGGNHWTVKNVRCEPRGQFLTFRNRNGEKQPVLASCLQVPHGPQDDKDFVRVAETLDCPAVTCTQVNEDDCMVAGPADRVVPVVTTGADLDLILKLQQKTLDAQAETARRLDTLEERVSALTPPGT